MTYIELINEFWRLNAIEPFNSTDTKVYLYLLHQCNIRGWINPFQLQTRNLELALGISRRAIIESRDRLKQRGLIDYTEGTRRCPSTYRIIMLADSSVSTFNARNNAKDKVEVPADSKSETNAECNTNCNTDNNTNSNTNDNTTGNTNKTKIKDLKENPLKGGKRKALSPAEMIGEYRRKSDNPNYLIFLDWIETDAPYVARNIQPPTETEFEKLKAAFGSNSMMRNILNLENRKDLRKKYASLYRTLINWCQRD